MLQCCCDILRLRFMRIPEVVLGHYLRLFLTFKILHMLLIV